MWVHSDGSPYEGLATVNTADSAFYAVPWPCGRCGGLGGGEQWRHTGWTCFECGGSGKRDRTRTIKLYSEPAYTKLAARREKLVATKLAKAQKLTAENARLARQREAAFIAENIDFCTDLAANAENNTILADMQKKLSLYGSLSVAQIGFASKLIAETQQRAIAPDCPVGRVPVHGTVVKTAMHDSQFGSTLKLTIKSPEGWLVWGSCPSSIACHAGDSVAFMATVERSDTDPKFGFYKRPKVLK